MYNISRVKQKRALKMRKMCGLTSSCISGIFCFSLKHSVDSNDSVCGQCRPRSYSAQDDPGLHCTHMLLGVIRWCEGVVYLNYPGRRTDIGLQLGKAY